MISRITKRSPGPRVLATVLGLWMIPACSGSSSTPTSSSTFDPKLSVIQQKVFQTSCVFSSCHGADSPQQGLNLSGSTHSLLVNHPSAEVPTRMLVVPGDPSASYLFEKISSDHPTSGARMPYLSPTLPNDQIDGVQQWIEQGAQDD